MNYIKIVIVDVNMSICSILNLFVRKIEIDEGREKNICECALMCVCVFLCEFLCIKSVCAKATRFHIQEFTRCKTLIEQYFS